MIEHTKKMLLVVLAVVIIIIGILGLVLPLLPGIVLLMLGLLLLSMYNPGVETWLNKLTHQHPFARDTAESLKKFLERIIGKK